MSFKVSCCMQQAMRRLLVLAAATLAAAAAHLRPSPCSLQAKSSNNMAHKRRLRVSIRKHVGCTLDDAPV